ncbi:phosphoglycerate mutase family [Aspergillus sp. HF37]|nr:phosphoglycerate mutase family [Aspergillus sp. HF37]
MGKPRMIILVRHAQSEGNKNREIHQMVPDHRVKLTGEGHRQARDAGRRLRNLLRPDDSLHFFTSPYRRTRETTEGILESVSTDTPSPSPFPRHTIQVYEEPRLREQDFGNFQPCSAEMERMWLERADYGHFFYRIPNGESAADAYDRVSGFNESLWRLFGEDDFASVCVLVTHGLMTRVFLMKWYHWSVEYFEDLRNVNHCEFVVMKLNPDNGKYALDNQLRTWSETRVEKEQERQHDRAAKGLNPAPPSEMTIPIRRKWGGCPDGCNHGIRKTGSRRVRRDTDGIRKGIEQADGDTKDSAHTDTRNMTATEPGVGDITPPERARSPGRGQHQHPGTTSPFSTARPSTQTTPTISSDDINRSKHDHTTKPKPRRPNLLHFHRDSEDHLLHPPRTSSPFLHLTGRDGGGTSSGANSIAASEDEREEPRRVSPLRELQLEKPSQDLENDGDDEGSGTAQKPRSRSYRRRSNQLDQLAQDVSQRFTGVGDGSTAGSQDGSQDGGQGWGRAVQNNADSEASANNAANDDIEGRRRFDQSIRGSVY